MYSLGIIGCGNMAYAIANGILKSNLLSYNEIIMSDIDISQREKIEKLKIHFTDDNLDLVSKSDNVLFAIKPQFFDSALNNAIILELKNKLVISIMAGVKIEKIANLLDNNCNIARVMPNTPALVNEAMSVICFDKNVNDSQKNMVIDIFKSIGKTKIIEDEDLLNAVTAISGSSPAYIFMMIEAMADAAVSMGLKRDDAYFLAAQSIFGSAKLYLDTKKHPAILKDMVCSPKGTTIEAVKILERKGFRNSLIEAMEMCEKKSRLLS